MLTIEAAEGIVQKGEPILDSPELPFDSACAGVHLDDRAEAMVGDDYAAVEIEVD